MIDHEVVRRKRIGRSGVSRMNGVCRVSRMTRASNGKRADTRDHQRQVV